MSSSRPGPEVRAASRKWDRLTSLTDAPTVLAAMQSGILAINNLPSTAQRNIADMGTGPGSTFRPIILPEFDFTPVDQSLR